MPHTSPVQGQRRNWGSHRTPWQSGCSHHGTASPSPESAWPTAERLPILDASQAAPGQRPATSESAPNEPGQWACGQQSLTAQSWNLQKFQIEDWEALWYVLSGYLSSAACKAMATARSLGTKQLEDDQEVSSLQVASQLTKMARTFALTSERPGQRPPSPVQSTPHMVVACFVG